MPRNATEAFGTRTYRTPGGWVVPSVTTILGALDKPWMGPWAAKLAAEYAFHRWDELSALVADGRGDAAISLIKGAPFRRRDEAAEHGTAVHAVSEAIATEAPFTIPESLIPHRDALLAWHELYRPTILETEQQVCREPSEDDEAGWAGSFDMLVQIAGTVYLVDLKTSKSLDEKWSLQLAGYATAPWFFHDRIRWEWPVSPTHGAILWVPSDRPQQWQFLARPFTEADFAAWRRLVDLYGYLQAAKKDHGFELVIPQTEETAA